MKKPASQQLMPLEVIERRIYLVRGHKVMFDFDLAALYQVPTKALNQAVRRNIARFPEDFMFQLTAAELANWRSQIVTSNPAAKMGLRRPPLVFTEHGVAMLSSVLQSDRAVQVNIAIVRTFVRLRQLLATHKELAERLAAMEKKYDQRLKVVFDILKQLMEPPPLPPKRPIGFSAPERGKK
jgi:ORF6N domain